MQRREFIGSLAGGQLANALGKLPVAKLANKESAIPTAQVVAVIIDGTLFLGAVGEKIAGGLFEVVLYIEGREVSCVFRLSEMMDPRTGRPASVPGAVPAEC